MAQVTLRINGYGYTLGCRDGEEQHLEAMGAEVNKRIDGIRNTAGPSGEARMLLMAALMLADELHEAQTRPGPGTGGARHDPKLTRKLNKMATRAEEIAQDMQPPEGE